MNLYRIISLEAFLSILVNRTERYTRPCKWEDCYESYLLQQLDSEAKRKELVRLLYTTVSPQNALATVTNYMKIWNAKWWAYAQCWSKVADSDAMWRIYSYNKHSIQICSTDKKILSMLNAAGTLQLKPIAKSVKYDVDESTDIFMSQVRDMKQQLTPFEPYFHKRVAFKHEREYRVLINDYSKKIISELGIGGALFNLKTDGNEEDIIDDIFNKVEKFAYKYDDKKGSGDGIVSDNMYIPIANMTDYINEVRVNPMAEDWYVSLIENICKQYSVPFGGKSTLYTLK